MTVERDGPVQRLRHETLAKEREKIWVVKHRYKPKGSDDWTTRTAHQCADLEMAFKAANVWFDINDNDVSFHKVSCGMSMIFEQNHDTDNTDTEPKSVLLKEVPLYEWK